jgi:hypothetical protein
MESCPICLESVPEGVRLFCGHKFHMACLQTAMKLDPLCPVCRKPTMCKTYWVRLTETADKHASYDGAELTLAEAGSTTKLDVRSRLQLYEQLQAFFGCCTVTLSLLSEPGFLFSTTMSTDDCAFATCVCYYSLFNACSPEDKGRVVDLVNEAAFTISTRHITCAPTFHHLTAKPEPSPPPA